MMCKMKAMFNTRKCLSNMWKTLLFYIFLALSLHENWKICKSSVFYHDYVPPNRMDSVATEQSLGKGWAM